METRREVVPPPLDLSRILIERAGRRPVTWVAYREGRLDDASGRAAHRIHVYAPELGNRLLNRRQAIENGELLRLGELIGHVQQQGDNLSRRFIDRTQRVRIEGDVCASRYSPQQHAASDDRGDRSR